MILFYTCLSIYYILWGSSGVITYDAIIGMSSLADIITGGKWRVEFLTDKLQAVFNTEKVSTMHAINGNFVSLLGAKNSGKTFLLNLLCNDGFKSSQVQPTNGIRLYLHKMTKQLLFMDKRGHSSPVPFGEDTNSSRADAIASEAFITKTLLELASYCILVLEYMTDIDQLMLENLQEYCLDAQKRNQTKVIIVVHNYSRCESVSAGSKYFQEIVNIYCGNKITAHRFVTEPAIYLEVAAGVETGQAFQHYHIFLINNNSNSGHTFNLTQVRSIRSWLANVQVEVPLNKFASRMCEIMNGIFKRYLIVEGVEENPRINCVGLGRELYFTLSERRGVKIRDMSPEHLLGTSFSLLSQSHTYLHNMPNYYVYETNRNFLIFVEAAGTRTESVTVYCDYPSNSETKATIRVTGNRESPLQFEDGEKIIKTLRSMEFGEWSILIPVNVSVENTEKSWNGPVLQIKCKKRSINK